MEDSIMHAAPAVTAAIVNNYAHVKSISPPFSETPGTTQRNATARDIPVEKSKRVARIGSGADFGLRSRIESPRRTGPFQSICRMQSP